MNVSTEIGPPCLDHGCKGFGLGYATAWIVRDGVRFTTTKHRKVHFEATGEWPEVVRHTCDNPRCINPAHLVGGTQKDNVADMYSRGRNKHGSDARRGEARGYGVKLMDAEVAYIRSNYIPRHKEFGVTALANQHGVSIAQISRIIHGQRRKET